MAGDTPLIAGRIHGVRRWSVGWRAGDAELRGFGNARWKEAGEPTRARCRAGGRRTRGAHRAPNGDCSCGLYALHPWEAPRDLHGGPGGPADDVFGVVEAWGRVELHANGFRAQYARPVALALVGVPRASDAGHAVARLAERYRAELIEVADPGELREHCRERGWGLSREVVRSLLPDDEPADPAPSPLTAGPTPARPQSRLARLGEHAVTGLGVLLALAWYGFLAWVAVMVVISIVNGEFGSTGSPFSSQKLRVIDEALVKRHGDLRYVAVVRNTSEERIAVSAFARGEVLDRDGDRVARIRGRRKADLRPTLLPGETGVVIDELPGSRPPPARPRFETRLLARRAPAGGATAPLALGEPALDRERCRLAVAVDAGRSARGAGIAIVVADPAGQISAAGAVSLERDAVERGRQTIPLVDQGGCPDWLREAAVYPALTPEVSAIARAARQTPR